MASIQNCTYKSVSLLAGEKFVLPPDAELVSSSAGITAITSTCALPNTLEQTVCYKFKFSGSENINSNTNPNWEQDNNFQVKGIVVNGLYYPFANYIQLGGSGASSSSFSTWLTALNSTPFNGLFNFENGNPVYGNESSKSNGFTLQVAFNVIPSIGSTLEFLSTTITQYQGPDFAGETTSIYTKGEPC